MYWPGTTAAATGRAGFEAKRATPVSTPGADPLGTVLSPQVAPAQVRAAQEVPAQVRPAQGAPTQGAPTQGVPARAAPVRAVPVRAVPAQEMTARVAPPRGVPAIEPEVGSVTLHSGRNPRQLPCVDDPDLFFAESPADVESAKALCSGCPVRLACFTGAMERREPWGVWGGELFLRGIVVPRKRPRGRPRKTEVAA